MKKAENIVPRMPKQFSRHDGFTLIELMIVIAMISILATMALPSFQDRIIRTQVREAFEMASVVQKEVSDFYKEKRRFPAGNDEAGLPKPEKFIGNYVKSIAIDHGVISITLGNRINKHLEGKSITIRPAIVADAPIVPIAWVYAYASVPKGMTVIGKNTTTVLRRHLPINCRY